jgi:hypothetical protein
MRKFRLKVWDDAYRPLKPDEVYDALFIPDGWNLSVGHHAGMYPKEWQEVFPVHKDTDLGYFSGLVLQSLIPVCKDLPDHKLVVFSAIEIAKELIAQLDKEVSNG